ncbi:MAG: TIGR01212 family radical SAM protein [Candidatus Omnitrophica bacterium]|nr:TIGR01212 family radical SAM protein [Candidatus Omnitrophota bacterium]
MQRYNSFNQYLRKRYGEKVQRIGLNAGFSCPNKDGCIFCNEAGFSQFAGTEKSLSAQLEESIRKNKEKRGANKFIAYFQNASGTNAAPEELKEAYDAIKQFPDVVGLFISTRPDCIDGEKLDLIADYADDYEVWIEYGLQTVHEKSLRWMGRGHTFCQTKEAIEMAAQKGIKVGVHVILGIPGESPDDMISTAKEISDLPVSGVKLHVLHVLKNTELERMYLEKRLKLLSKDEYVKRACDFIERLSAECIILRLVSDAKKEYLIAPGWINDKLSVINKIDAEFAKRGTRQGIRRGVKK